MSLARLAAPDIDAICEAVDDSFRVGLRYSRGGNYGAGSESDWLQRLGERDVRAMGPAGRIRQPGSGA